MENNLPGLTDSAEKSNFGPPIANFLFLIASSEAPNREFLGNSSDFLNFDFNPPAALTFSPVIFTCGKAIRS